MDSDRIGRERMKKEREKENKSERVCANACLWYIPTDVTELNIAPCNNAVEVLRVIQLPGAGVILLALRLHKLQVFFNEVFVGICHKQPAYNGRKTKTSKRLFFFNL